MSPAALAVRLERRLAREGLAPLDQEYESGPPSISNRGSGKVLDATRAFNRESATEERRQRDEIMRSRRRFRRGERRIYALYASGMTLRQIERKTGVGYVTVFRLVSRIEREHRRPPSKRLGELLGACEPKTVVLVFGLIERALSHPREMRMVLAQARSTPALRVLIDPEDVRLDGRERDDG